MRKKVMDMGDDLEDRAEAEAEEMKQKVLDQAEEIKN